MFWLNVAAAVIQILTAVIMVGWIMSIFWGMDMVILASQFLFLCRVALQICVAHINTGDELQMQHTSAVILKLHARIAIVPNENK